MTYDIGPKIGIDGEAEFRKSINNITQNVKTLGTEMASVTSAYDKNDKSTANLTAQNEVLNKQITAQKEKLEKLTDGLAECTKKYGENDNKTLKWQAAVNTATAELNKMERQLAENNQALEDAGDGADDFSNGMGDVSKSLDDAGEAGLKFGDILKANILSDAILSGVKALAGAVTDLARDLAGVAKESVGVAAELKAESSQFEQTFGDLEDTARAAVKGIADETGILETRLNGTAASIYAFARSSGGTTEESMDLMQTALQAAADSAAYYDKSLEDASETLMSFLKGNFANDAALGLSATEATRNAKAMELFGTEYKNLTEIEKQKTLLKMVTDAQELSGAMGQAARESEGWENVLGNLEEVGRQIKGKIGAPILEEAVPAIQALTTSLSGLLSGEMDFSAFAQSIGDQVAGMAGKLAEALPGLVAKASEIGGQILQGVKSSFPALASAGKEIITWIVSGVTESVPELINSGVYLMGSLGEGIRENLPALMSTGLDAITSFTEGLRENVGLIVDGAIDLAKNFAKGLADSIPTIVEKVPTIVSNIANTINDNAPKILKAAVDIIGTLVKGLIDSIPTIIENMPKIIAAIWDTITAINWLSLGSNIIKGLANGVSGAVNFAKNAIKTIAEALKNGVKGLPDAFLSIGKNIIQGLINGIKSMATSLVKNIKSVVTSAVSGVKSLLGINSPSKVFAGIGGYMAEGLGVGFGGEIPDVQRRIDRSMNELVNSASGYTIPVQTAGAGVSAGGQYPSSTDLAAAIKSAMAGMGVYLGDRQVGEIVTNRQRNNARASGAMVMTY